MPSPPTTLFMFLTEPVCRASSRSIVLMQLFMNKPVMSDCDSSCKSPQKNKRSLLCEGCEGSEDEDRKLKRREKNRVAAQKSRKRQTQRADFLHEACELLEQRNRKLRREVDSLHEEQRMLSETLRAHERFCPIMHCSFASCSLQPDTTEARSV